jgi:putative ABC transport system ATP-binding protein
MTERDTAQVHEGPPAPLIELRQVTKTYGAGAATMQALRGIDLRVADGDFVAVMGPSGSGKSTVMNILGCLDTPTSGSYRFRGIDVGGLSHDQRALLRRYYLGFVFQNYNLLSRTSALENVELPLIYRRTPARERRARAFEALRLVSLERWADHTPSELSGGQQQRVAVARAVVTEPAVLLADEPTGNLDSQCSREIIELLSTLNRERAITVVMVTHEPGMAAYARRIVRFMDGLVADETRSLSDFADHSDPTRPPDPSAEGFGPQAEASGVRAGSGPPNARRPQVEGT